MPNSAAELPRIVTLHHEREMELPKSANRVESADCYGEEKRYKRGEEPYVPVLRDAIPKWGSGLAQCWTVRWGWGYRIRESG